MRDEIQRLEARNAALEAELAKARKNSSTSSKPPSSDIVKPPRADKQRKKKGKRRPGGQKGHPRHTRPQFGPDQIDKTWEYTLDSCPDCGGHLQLSQEPPRIIQQVEIVECPTRVEEHRSLAYGCRSCQKVHYAPIDAEVKRAGLVGPRLTALIAYLKGACHASFSTIRRFLRDVVGIQLSRGQLAKLVMKVSDSLEHAYDELRGLLPRADRLNVDETGHPEQRKRLWTWCFRAELYTLYRIDPSRGSNVLLEMLGKEFNGVLGCDYFSAYRKYMKDFHVTLQFCLAHLIRDVKFLVEHPIRANRRYGEVLLGHLRKLFGVIHRRHEYASQERFQRALTAVRNALVTDAIVKLPQTREAGNLAYRLLVDFDGYFRFITTPGVEPTNNLAEQAIRFVAIHRRITQGTRGERGRRWCERIWTVITTCTQQGRSSFQFVYQTVKAMFRGKPRPTLVPSPRWVPNTS